MLMKSNRNQAYASWLDGRQAHVGGLTKSRQHDRTVRRPRLHAVNRPSCAVVLDRKQSTGVQSSGPRTGTQVLHARDVLY